MYRFVSQGTHDHIILLEVDVIDITFQGTCVARRVLVSIILLIQESSIILNESIEQMMEQICVRRGQKLQQKLSRLLGQQAHYQY